MPNFGGQSGDASYGETLDAQNRGNRGNAPQRTQNAEAATEEHLWFLFRDISQTSQLNNASYISINNPAYGKMQSHTRGKFIVLDISVEFKADVKSFDRMSQCTD